MKRIYPRIVRPSDGDYDEIAEISKLDLKSFYNFPLLFIYNKRAAILGSGTGDDVSFFYEDGYVYVLSTQERLGYAGLDTYDAETLIKGSDGVFFQNIVEQLEDVKDFFDHREMWQLKVLMNYAD